LRGLSDDAVSDDLWGPLRRRVAVFTAAGGPLFAAYAITHSSTLEGVVVGGPLMAAGGFAIAALAAGPGTTRSSACGSRSHWCCSP
jgi:hypothetical protein